MWNTYYAKIFFALAWVLSLFSVSFAIGFDFPAQIAYIGTDYNVYSMTSNQTYQLTTNGGINKIYQWITWSPDGRLAYFCCDLSSARSIDTTVYISSDGIEEGRVVLEGRAQQVIYAYWSPENCQNDLNCHDLGILSNNLIDGTMSVSLVRDFLEKTEIIDVASGAPFYFDFAPSGEQMILHRNSQNLDFFDVMDASVKSSTITSSGTFQTPKWSPVDNRILVGVTGSNPQLTDLVTIDGDQQVTVAKDISGFLSFLWSPNGRYVAYRTITSDGFGTLKVVDSETGELVSETAENIIAFFWAPNSQRLATVSLANETRFSQKTSQLVANNLLQQNEEVQLGWSTLDIASGRSRFYGNFSPTYEMGYLLAYFDQFSPSHPLWSPDSRYLVFSELRDNEGKISVLDIDGAGTSTTIANGYFATWSFR